MKLILRIILGILGVLGAVALASFLFFLASDAGDFGRVIVSILIAGTIIWFGVGYFRQFSHPPPPDPLPVDVDPRLKLVYVCEMCGLELAVVRAAREKAPRHCGEEMVLLRR